MSNTNSVSAIAANALAAVIENGIAPDQSAKVTDGRVEVVLLIRAFTPNSVRLSKTHARILAALASNAKPARAIAREAGFSHGSLGAVRQGLADLVRLGKVVHTPDGYFLSNT